MFGLTAFVSSTAVSLLRTESERGQIRKAFSTYLSPDLVAELSKDPDKLKLGGERRDITVLFRGYSWFHHHVGGLQRQTRGTHGSVE